ncbi:MAG TPA: outer membrane beta-barrel protein [Gemmatimonadales bacterium]|nr:outer membrane beta-barrel protein [Gemmatimonadales bacterium]
MSIWKSTTCFVGLLALLGGAGRRGAAQGGNGDLEEKAPLVVSGFAVGLGSYDRNLAQNTALGSKLALSLFRPWSDQLYFFGQLTTRLEQSDSGPPETAIEIDNLIINWTPAHLTALTLSFGRFDAPIGFERDDEPLNLVPTTSFTFETARPVKFTGLMARYTLNPKISVLGLVANGWDQEADNNSGKTGGLKVQVFPSSRLAVAAGALYGPEADSTNGAQRTLITGDATWQPTQRLIVQAEAHHGSQQGTTWSGVVGEAFWRAGRSTGLTIRGEVMDDPAGARTGTAQKLSSVTISPWYFYREAQEGVFANVEFTNFRLPAFSIRPALRIDHSTQPVFEKKNGSLVRSNVIALVELVYLF